MTEKQRADEIVRLLKLSYVVPECTLDYADAWQLLVAVRLAAQCTDARVNVVTKVLFAQYGSPQALAAAPVEKIEEIVHPCGLGNTKAHDIKAAMTIVSQQYGEMLPQDFDSLLALPGVGRKSANLIVGDVFGQPAIVTDTHCIRLSNRMGLVNSRVPVAVERQLRALIDPAESNEFCHRLVLHGRAVCRAARPDCVNCPLRGVCAENL